MEPGKDGVGDYSRILAGEFLKKEQKIFILSLYDKTVNGIVQENQKVNKVLVPCLRISKTESFGIRRKSYLQLLETFQPQWISLQFVPYAYQKKGLPLNLYKILLLKDTSIKLHIMFHELWIYPLNFKQHLVQFLQRAIIRNLIVKLDPKLITTQIPFYQNKLNHFGRKVLPLSIFSNIYPSGSDILKPNNKAQFRIVLFSQMEPKPALILFLVRFIEILRGNKLMPEFVLLGGGRSKQEQFKLELQKVLQDDTEIKLMGFLDHLALSKEFHLADLGVTSVPRHLLGKSGSVHAFLEHHIPVACPVNEGEIELEGFFNDAYNNSVFSEANFDQFLFAQSQASKLARPDRLSPFINLLQSNSENV
ncbi:hypothetical protein CJ305_15715 [Leeuwenhoekiella nanhaiensis]|uniref:Glycosyl transferase family 1 domain-containing protein n=1 Tax=Leeuwenhoekiella nanhaiensis TaxID=1655491 RepID=A0A2G1VNE3_9FLAO|nr:hypothetical protein CJ305_15715 [Leeuwenhoekiella nanhaiensis]